MGTNHGIICCFHPSSFFPVLFLPLSISIPFLSFLLLLFFLPLGLSILIYRTLEGYVIGKSWRSRWRNGGGVKEERKEVESEMMWNHSSNEWTLLRWWKIWLLAKIAIKDCETISLFVISRSDSLSGEMDVSFYFTRWVVLFEVSFLNRDFTRFE